MKLSIGIVGLPNVGKSTLFKLLTKQNVVIANYPFATIDPNIGIVPVPDERLQKLTKLSDSKKTVPAIVEFYDIAGLVKGASAGEGLGNQFLSHIRDVNAVLQVIRVFKSNEIVHVEGGTDPARDFEIIKTELCLKDLEIVTKQFEKAESEAKSGKKEAIGLRDGLREIKKYLDEGNFLQDNIPLIRANKGYIKGLNLLTAKAQLFLLNGEEKGVPAELIEKIKDLGAEYVVADLSKSVDLSGLIQKAYKALDLISFFTTGEDETRAWTITRGAKAPEAAGVIHTDFEEKFIRAEVVPYQKLIEACGWNQVKKRGWLRIEGRDYVTQDGDVMVIRHG